MISGRIEDGGFVEEAQAFLVTLAIALFEGGFAQFGGSEPRRIHGQRNGHRRPRYDATNRDGFGAAGKDPRGYGHENDGGGDFEGPAGFHEAAQTEDALANTGGGNPRIGGDGFEFFTVAFAGHPIERFIDGFKVRIGGLSLGPTPQRAGFSGFGTPWDFGDVDGFVELFGGDAFVIRGDLTSGNDGHPATKVGLVLGDVASFEGGAIDGLQGVVGFGFGQTSTEIARKVFAQFGLQESGRGFA